MLTLEAASDREGTVALWMSPVLYEAKLSPRAVVNVAHRGGIVPGYPENTLAAFRRAITIGVDAIEIDLRGTKDSEIVIIHGGLAATTNGRGGTRNHTLAELLRLDAGGGERIPTYEAVLELVAGTGVTLLLDVNAGPELDRRKVVRQTERYDAVADVIAGVRTLDDLRLFQQLNPDIRTLGFIGDFDEIDDFVAAGADIIRLWPMWIWADPATVTRLQGMGIPVWTTAGQASREELESLISLGIDGILTDFPGAMAELVASREAASGGR